MNDALLEHYNRELQHLREMAAEFAAEYPKIAGRLAIEEFDCADPYVERLLEGFAFMAARVQLKLDAQFSDFTHHLLDIVYPHFLAPVPSMTIVKFEPKLTELSIAEGAPIPKGTQLRSSVLSKGEQTACEYRTAHDFTLWPLEIKQLEYLPTRAAVASAGCAENLSGVLSGLRITLGCTAGLAFNQLSIDKLSFYLSGSGDLPYRLYQLLVANAQAMVCCYGDADKKRLNRVSSPFVKALGFAPEEAMLANTPRTFDGYRILQEYFAFPQRFLFVELFHFNQLFAGCDVDEVELLILFNRSDEKLINALNTSHISLFCVPAINLFAKKADPINANSGQREHHLVIDKMRPIDFEVYSVTKLSGYESGRRKDLVFLPFYGSKTGYHSNSTAFYTLRRQERLLSDKQEHQGARSTYKGSECFVSLVDSENAPYSSDLFALQPEVLCTNRDLPLFMPIGLTNTDFTLQIAAPYQSIKCIGKPTTPKYGIANEESAWRLINHLSLNYLSLLDETANNAHQEQGAVALRELLALYCDKNDSAAVKKIAGVVSVSAKSVVRRISSSGPMVFGRGLEITLMLDESAFEGSSYFLMAAVLEHFFAHYVSINSFVQTVVKTTERGEVARWPVRTGQRKVL